MDRSESVSNSFELDGMFLLTAPNMSGKSTLMRSTAAAAHMINAGLCAPVKPGSSVRRFDSIFLRGASADVPTEDKSAFGAEMGDVASLLRSSGRKSLVFVDEIGRGTSPKDGTSLAGAILEQMSVSCMSGMFATHLHGILNLPYSSAAEARLRKKRMAITDVRHGELKWTYILEDGICTNR
jgi:DNA mismatch repair ATPase MutS